MTDPYWSMTQIEATKRLLGCADTCSFFCFVHPNYCLSCINAKIAQEVKA